MEGLYGTRRSALASAAVRKKVSVANGRSFQTVLSKTKAQRMETNKPTVVKQLANFLSEWNRAERKTAEVVRGLPKEATALVGLQITVNRLHMKTVLITKAGEALSSTIRRTQQMSAG